jgi:hypothetical protein
MMKLTAVCALLLAPLAFADQASKDAKIDQLFQAMNIEAQQKQMLAQMQQMVTSQVKSQLPSEADKAKAEEMQKKIFALIEQETSWQKMKPVMVKAYGDTYTEPEIDGILAFYKSPAGKAMIEKQPTLMSKMMTGMQAQMTDIMSEVEKLMRQQ